MSGVQGSPCWAALLGLQQPLVDGHHLRVKGHKDNLFDTVAGFAEEPPHGVDCDQGGPLSRVAKDPRRDGRECHGGIAQGVAQALMEEIAYDCDGNPLTTNFADYGIISMAELPSFELASLETPTPNNPLGVKGIGESGSIGSTPAVQSAVLDALSPWGIRHLDVPLTPLKVWSAISAAAIKREKSN